MNLYRFTLIYVFIVSIVFALFSSQNIPFQFYFWEIFIDLKIFSLVAFFVIVFKQQKLLLDKIQFFPRQWNWQQNLVGFLLPIGIYIVVIIMGYLLNGITIDKSENAVTKILATVFDIPAIFFFSIATVYVEEIFFRAFLYPYLNEKISSFLALIFSSLIWMGYNISELFSISELNIQIVLTLLAYFFSIGCITTILYKKYNSVLPGYSFRVGVISLTPVILSSLLIESDSFIKTTSILFFSDGVIASMVLLILSYILFLRNSRIQETPVN